MSKRFLEQAPASLKAALSLMVCWTFCSGLSGAALSAQQPVQPSDAAGGYYRLPLPLTTVLATKPMLADTIAWRIQAWLKIMERPDVLVAISATADEASLARWRSLLVDQPTRRQYSEALVLREINATLQSDGTDPALDYFDPLAGASHAQNADKGQKGKKIRTEISLLIEYLDGQTGAVLGFGRVRGVGRSGSQHKSKIKALQTLYEQLMLELERIYGIAADVAYHADNKLTVALGNNDWVEQNDLLILIAPEQLADRTEPRAWQPAGPAGFARVTGAGDSLSIIKIIRQWRPLPAGSFALPYSKPLFSLILQAQPPIFTPYAQYGLNLHGSPLADLDLSVGAHLIRSKDSDDRQDWGVGFSLCGRGRLWESRRMDAGLQIGVGLDLPMRKDDQGATVSTMLFSAQTLMTTEIVLSYRMNLIIGAGYRWTTRSTHWTYSDGEESYAAYWDQEAPEAGRKGCVVAFGFRYCLF